MTFQPRLGPTLFTVPSLIILVALGFWQLDRLAWKEGLINQFESRLTQPVQPIPSGELNPEEHEFLRVEVTGTFDHENEFFLIHPSRQGKPGVHVITPLTPSSGGEAILISRGWAPLERREPSTRLEGLYQGEVTIKGLLRFPKELGLIHGWVLPENEPHNNTWFWLDTAALAEKGGYESFPNFYVMSEEEPPLGIFPRGRQWLLDIRNNHLEYAITWFLLAMTLAVVYVAFTVKSGAKQ